MMKTRSRVNHTVREMPRRMHNKLSKGLKKITSILDAVGDGRCRYVITRLKPY